MGFHTKIAGIQKREGKERAPTQRPSGFQGHRPKNRRLGVLSKTPAYAKELARNPIPKGDPMAPSVATTFDAHSDRAPMQTESIVARVHKALKGVAFHFVCATCCSMEGFPPTSGFSPSMNHIFPTPRKKPESKLASFRNRFSLTKNASKKKPAPLRSFPP